MGTLLLASEMPVPIPQSRTVSRCDRQLVPARLPGAKQLGWASQQPGGNVGQSDGARSESQLAKLLFRVRK